MSPEQAAALLEILVEAQRLGFLGPADVSAQLDHSLGVAAALDSRRGPFLDLGSGAGLPGIVLALSWPDVSGVLVDASARRCEALERATLRLGLERRVSVLRGRAEELGREPELRETQGLVVARSFGPPAVVAECGSPFVHVEGVLAVTEPPDYCDRAAVRWSAVGLAELGLELAERRTAGATTVAVLRKKLPVDDRWPRRTGIPAKRPLWT